MIRGTTPTHTFELEPEIDPALIKKVKVIYAQNDNVIFVKAKDACVFEGNVVKVHLSQEDTLKFDCKKNVQIQLAIKTIDGEVHKSEIVTAHVYKCLGNEVI